MLELNKIYNEDCLQGMKKISDKSIDMVLCDLPYGQTSHDWYYNLSFPVLLDKEAEVALRYKVKTIPATYMINSDGTIHGKVVGPMNYSTMLEKIEKMY